jgi:FkbM family methyltransferase
MGGTKVQIAMAPSEIIEAHITYQGRQVRVHLPQNEAAVVREIFERQEYALPAWYVPADPMQVWDVGANVGLFALYMKLIHPQSVIYCYEPAPVTVALCRANTASQPDVHVYPFGLYSQEQEAAMNLDTTATVLNSILPTWGNRGNSVTVQLKDAGAEFDRLELAHLHVLKIDTEGCEVAILESLAASRLNRVDCVLVEFHSEADRRRIDQLLPDFHLYGFHTFALGIGVARYVHHRLLPQSLLT